MSEGPTREWRDYVEKTKERPPRELLVRAMPFVHQREAALDLGPGALHDSRYLIEQGFAHVTALDKEPVADDIAQTLSADHFTYAISSFEDYSFPKNAFDLINAQYSLSFIRPDAFPRTFGNIIDSLKEEGVFTGNLFGDRDEWADNPELTFLTEPDARKLFEGLTLHEFTEFDGVGTLIQGPQKHWHRFSFIAEKPKK